MNIMFGWWGFLMPRKGAENVRKFSLSESYLIDMSWPNPRHVMLFFSAWELPHPGPSPTDLCNWWLSKASNSRSPWDFPCPAIKHGLKIRHWIWILMVSKLKLTSKGGDFFRFTNTGHIQRFTCLSKTVALSLCKTLFEQSSCQTRL